MLALKTSYYVGTTSSPGHFRIALKPPNHFKCYVVRFQADVTTQSSPLVIQSR